jgi:hypothetical protein
MASLIKRFAPVFPVVTILAVLLCVAGMPLAQSGRQQLASSALGTQSLQPKTQSARQLRESTEDFESTLMSLNTARLNLLRMAAQNSDDGEALRAAAKSYRESIIQLRSKILELTDKRGPDDLDRLVGMIMSNTVPMSQRVLSAEIFGTLDEPETVPTE